MTSIVKQARPVPPNAGSHPLPVLFFEHMLNDDSSIERELARAEREALTWAVNAHYKLTRTKEAATRILVCIYRSMFNIVGPTCT